MAQESVAAEITVDQATHPSIEAGLQLEAGIPLSEAWRWQANCLGINPDSFLSPVMADMASEVCKGCTVVVQCREDAIATNAVGVRAGIYRSGQ